MHVNKFISTTEAFFFSTENIKIILHFLKCYFYSVAVFSWANAQNPQSVTATYTKIILTIHKETN